MAKVSFQDVCLRPMAESDQEMVMDWRSNPELARFMYTDSTNDLGEQKRWFRSIQERKDCEYWIIECEGEPLGVANLVLRSDEHSRTDWAFYLGSPAARGKGVGSKVETAVIYYVFKTLGLDKLHCQVFSENQNVIGLHTKFGFEEEGCLKKHFYRGGVWQDLHLLSLFRQTVEERKYLDEEVKVENV